MAVDGLTQVMRHRLGLGRLLPLGEAPDGSWMAETAAAGALRAAAADAVPDVRLESLRLSAPDGGTSGAGAPALPGALPHGPLHIEAGFAAAAGAVLPAVADRLREALLDAADRRLGLRVRAADLQVTALLDAPYDARRDVSPPAPPTPAAQTEGGSGVAAAVLAVPGVTRLAPVLGGLSTAPAPGVSRCLPSAGAEEGLLIQCAVAADRRVLDVARAVRTAAAEATARGQTVSLTLLVTAVDGVPDVRRPRD